MLRVLPVLLLLMLIPTGAARAAEDDLFFDQCFTNAPGCTAFPSANPAVDVELSPDGKQLYEYDRSPQTLRILDRGLHGTLTPRTGAGSCFNVDGAGGCTPVPAMTNNDVYDIAITPDGGSLYAAAGAAMISFRRDASGGLTASTCYGTTAGCTSIAPLGAVYSVVASLDSQDVYTRGGNTFGAFQRDPATGALIKEPDGPSCFSETAAAGCVDSYGLGGNAFEMSFSPDGKHLYFPAQVAGGIGFFIRSANGSLSQISGTQGGCVTETGSSSTANECATIADGSGHAMANAWSATVSPTGRTVFISGANGAVAFRRDAASGLLTKSSCFTPSTITGCVQHPGSAGMGVKVSPDGRRAIIGGYDIGGIGYYALDDSNGTLTPLPDPRSCFAYPGRTGCGTLPAGGIYGKSTWAPDGLEAYVAANGLLSFTRDEGPTCAPLSAEVPFQTSVAIQLSCSDPNGDPTTASIISQPAAGQLGAVTADNTVRYNPFSAYTGPDSFEYAGVARGVTGPPAKVTLTVKPAATAAPSPSPSASATPPPTATPTPAEPKAPGKVRFRKRTLIVSKLLAGSKVVARCAPKRRCPFTKKSLKVHKGKAVVRRVTFKKGAKLTVTITKAGYTTRKVTLRFKKKNRP